MSESLTQESAGKFGTFKGVFVPSILTIFGVIMYLRLGWVAGNAGVFGTALIVTFGSAITFLTALSISSIATNMRIGAGGAYFMISRSFGLEAGAAIGIPLFLAQAFGTSFYVAGFAESMHGFFPVVSPQVISLAALFVLTAITFLSADLALKAQFLILAVIVASLVSFFLGGPPQGGSFGMGGATEGKEIVSFWKVFAVFFPAVTGIEAGVAMSGNLKNPARSLAVGTIGAVVIGYLVYLVIPMILLRDIPQEALRTDNSILLKYSLFPQIVVAGIWGATLSSALGALLGGPRTLQAMARDRVIPEFLGKGDGVTDEPRIATIVSFLIAAGGILLGDLNVIAPVLSMFFLTSYGFLNLVTALEGLIGSPSWRPKFRVHWSLSLLGAVSCFSVMLMIDAGSTYIAAIFTGLLYWITRKRNLRSRWQDLRRGVWRLMARAAIYHLDQARDEFALEETKTWSPNLLVLSGAPTRRWHLIEFANALSHGKGFLTVSAIVPQSGMTEERVRKIEHSMRQLLKKKRVRALVEVTPAESPLSGARYLIQSYGLGPIHPNTIVIGAGEEEGALPSFAELILTAFQARRNIVIIQRHNPDQASSSSDQKVIRVWTGGLTKVNAGLMLALAYLLQGSREWVGSDLILSLLVKSVEEREGAARHLQEYLKESRIDARTEAIVLEEKKSWKETIVHLSKDATTVFVGLRVPQESENASDYGRYLSDVFSGFRDLREVVFVLASQKIEFHKIFM